MLFQVRNKREPQSKKKRVEDDHSDDDMDGSVVVATTTIDQVAEKLTDYVMSSDVFPNYTVGGRY